MGLFFGGLMKVEGCFYHFKWEEDQVGGTKKGKISLFGDFMCFWWLFWGQRPWNVISVGEFGYGDYYDVWWYIKSVRGHACGLIAMK